MNTKLFTGANVALLILPLFLVTSSIVATLPEVKAYVNPDQNVLSTSQVVVSVTVVPYGTAKQIVVNIGLATTIQ